ncbi:MAG: type II secretion system F family protein, partial [Phycisphaerae bacterium]
SRFPASYAGTIAAGIRSGDLGGTLYAVSSHLRLKGEVRRAMIEIIAYPAIVIVCAGCIISFLMRGLVPEIHKMYMDWGVKTLPLPTEFMVAVARVWHWVELGLLGVFAVAAALMIALNLPRMGGLREHLVRSLPGLGSVYWSSVLARFTHTSSLAALHGEPLDALLRSAGAASGSPALALAASRAATALAGGRSVADAVSAEPAIPALWRCVVESAGARGDLPGAMRELARAYEIRAEQRARIFRALFAPFLLISIGAIAFLVVLAMLLPFFHITSSLMAK